MFQYVQNELHVIVIIVGREKIVFVCLSFFSSPWKVLLRLGKSSASKTLPFSLPRQQP